MNPHGPAAKVQLFTSEQSSNMKLFNYHPARGTYNLTPMICISELPCDNAETQAINSHTLAVCYQAVAQYPMSFNDHTESHWLSS